MMGSRNVYVLTIVGCIVIIVIIFFSLSLDKIIIKPLIKNYEILDMQIRLEQLKSFSLLTTNTNLVSHGT